MSAKPNTQECRRCGAAGWVDLCPDCERDSWLDEPVYWSCPGCGCDVTTDKWCDDFEDYYCDRCYDAKVIDSFICDYALECPDPVYDELRALGLLENL